MVCLRHFFNSAFTLVPIQFLRLPDRWVPAKPWQTERINPFPTRVQMKICTNIAQSPLARNDMVSSNFSIPGKRKKRIRKILMRH